jgi:hypothetical protein
MWSKICVGLKTLKRKASVFKRARSKRSNPLEISSFSMMKKVVFLLVFGQNFKWPLAQDSVKFEECICRSIHTCFAFCLFMPSFFVT